MTCVVHVRLVGAFAFMRLMPGMRHVMLTMFTAFVRGLFLFSMSFMPGMRRTFQALAARHRSTSLEGTSLRSSRLVQGRREPSARFWPWHENLDAGIIKREGRLVLA